MFDKILVTLSLSSPIWATIPYAQHLSMSFGSELHLLALSTEPQHTWDRSLMDYIHTMANDLQEKNIVIKTNFIYGNPAVEIVKYIDQNKISLLVTTTGITNSILLSIARRMGIDNLAPVLIVPSKHPEETGSFNEVAFVKILVPLDFSEVSESVLPYVEAISHKVKSSVTLLHVNTPPFRGVPVLHNEVIAISRAAAVEYLKVIYRRLYDQGISTNFEVIDGSPARVIPNYAKQTQMDLIAMGSKCLSGIEGWLSGSVTSKVSERSEIPIFTVHQKTQGTIEVPTPVVNV